MKDKLFQEELLRMLPKFLRQATRKKNNIFSGGDISLAEVTVIEFLEEKVETNMSEIAAVLDLSFGAATSVVDKMVDKKLILRHRSREDRRKVLVSLDKKGRETARKIFRFRKETIDEFFSVLNADEKGQYVMLLRKVLNNIEREKQG
jgi:DNA-binding MarR family transcriptional regulator